jgi:membrane fusion protein (multidrug efflux system)
MVPPSPPAPRARLSDRQRARIPGTVWRALSFGLAILILIIFVTQWNRWEGEAAEQSTDDAYLQTDLTPLSAQVSGYVSDVPVQDYQSVQAGELIAKLDDRDYQAALSQTTANVAAAAAQIQQVQAQRPLLQANLRAAQAVADGTAANLAQSRRNLARAAKLLSSGSGAVEDVEKAQTVEDQLRATLDQNQAQADAVARQIDLLGASLAQARAALAAQQALQTRAQINLGYTRITAPSAGVIGVRQVFAGQYLAAGAQVTVLAALPRLWVIANFKETQLTHVVPGEAARITIDTFPGRILHGHVVAISPASGAELALLPPDNATGNFTKIVQRIAVKIAIDDTDGLTGRLIPGMSVIPTIDTVPASGPRP